MEQYQIIRKWKRVLATVLICCMTFLMLPNQTLAAQAGDSQAALQAGEKLQQNSESAGEADSEEEIKTENPADSEPSVSPESNEPEETKEPAVTEEPAITVSPESQSPEESLSQKSGIATLTIQSGWTADGRYRKGDGSYASSGWEQIASRWYYFDENGNLLTGWLHIASGTYYLKQTGEAGVKGVMLTGWQAMSGKTYYFEKTGSTAGKMLTGWQELDGQRYYFKASGEDGVKGGLWTGWLKQNGSIYYLKQTGEYGMKGRMLTGWLTMSGKTYYFKKSGENIGKMFTGFVSIGGQLFYFEPAGAYGVLGQRAAGWKTIGGLVYRFEESGANGVKGKALTGWQTIGKYQFYFMQSGTYKGKMLTGFNSIGGVKYFFKRTGDYEIKGAMLKGWQTIDGKRYYFGADGKMRKSTTVDGIQLGADGSAIEGKTLRAFLANALKPVGTTLYIWGGGHDDWKDGDAVRYGLNPNWKSFYNAQTSKYDYNNYRFQYTKGLDCSGFVGWSVYNTVYDKNNQMTCTTVSGGTPKLYQQRGWGSYVDETTACSFKPGDVVGWNGHVWIVLGQCSDGSVVLIHCTPQAGVQISGTVSKSGSEDSEAVKLAKTYMQEYYASCTKKMTMSYVGSKLYLYGPSNGGLHRFRWDLTGKKMLSDPDGYTNKTPQQILDDLL